MESTVIKTSVFLKAYRSLRQACDDRLFGTVGVTMWPPVVLSQKLEQLQTAHQLLPPVLRQRAWILTSVERAA